MLIRVLIQQEDKETAVAYLNPDQIAGIFSGPSRFATLKLAGTEKYYVSQETPVDVLKKFAPFQLAENVFGDFADKALWDQERLRSGVPSKGREAAAQAALTLMIELEKAAQSIVYDSFYEDNPDKARAKLQARFTDIVAGAIHSENPAAAAPSPDLDEPESS